MTAEDKADSNDLLLQAEQELVGCRNAWKSGNAGKARVGARRAAGMAIRACLRLEPQPGYGSNFMHHLAGVADGEGLPTALRESAHRLANRGWPDDGFSTPLPDPLEPSADANSIIQWHRLRCTALLAEGHPE
jgi:hypothetical protein